MYSPRQPRIYKGVNGGRFASYGDPHTKAGSTWPSKQAKQAKVERTKSGKKRKKPKRATKQLTVSARSKLKARHARAASRGKGRLRGRWR